MPKLFKHICIGVILLLVCAAGFVLGRYSFPDEITASKAVFEISESDPLESFRTERQQLRQLQLSQLNEIIHSERQDAKMIALAQQRQLELMQWTEQEFTLENVLSLRGFTDVVATVHTDSVNILLRAESITKQESALILELVARETGISGGNTKIIPLKSE